METRYLQLKNLIKEKSEFQRVLKNHRKTVNFKDERLRNIKLNLLFRKNWSGDFERKNVEIEELTPSIASYILNGEWNSCYGCGTTYDLSLLYTIYGILRNERKLKKVKAWEDITNSKEYKGSKLEMEVLKWKDEETIRISE